MNGNKVIATTHAAVEWFRVQEQIRNYASECQSEFTCWPSSGMTVDLVQLGDCLAELKQSHAQPTRYGVIFARRRSSNANVETEPEREIWRMSYVAHGDELYWRADQLAKDENSKELARAILTHLEEYCAAYEQQIHLL